MIIHIAFGAFVSMMYIYRKYFKTDQFVFLSYFSLILFLIAYFLFTVFPFSPDSFSYFDISNFIFSDFGDINTVRQYVIVTEKNISFPMLFPVLISIMNQLFDLGMLSGVVLNYYIVLVSVLVLDLLFDRFQLHKGYAVILSSLLVLNNSYLDELTAARAIPLNLLLIMVVIYLLARIKNSGKRINLNVAFIGLINGIMLMNRFDHLFTLILITILIIFALYRLNKLPSLIFYIISFSIAIIPWVVYSLLHFDAIFISDNSGTFFLVNPQGPLRFSSNLFIINDFFNAPTDWIRSFITLKVPLVIFGVLILGFGSLPIAVYIMIRSLSIISDFSKLSNLKNIFYHPFLFIVLYAFFRTGLFILVGYGDSRYHLETMLVFSLGVIVYGQQDYEFSLRKNGFASYLIIASLLFASANDLLQKVRGENFIAIEYLGSNDLINKSNILSEDENLIIKFIEEQSQTSSSILVLTSEINPFRLGALSELSIYAQPRIDDKDLDGYLEFSKLYSFNYIIVDNSVSLDYLKLMGLESINEFIISETISIIEVNNN